MEIIIIFGAGIGVAVLSYLMINAKSRANARKLFQVGKEETFLQNCKVHHLSNRETEVTRLMLRGWTYRAVADHLFIAEKTVDSHIQNIYSKTGVRNKLGLYNLLYRDYS